MDVPYISVCIFQPLILPIFYTFSANRQNIFSQLILNGIQFYI